MVTILRGWFVTPRPLWRRWLRIAFLCLIAAPPGQAASLLINHDFSDGLNGWLMMATVFDTGEAGVLSDQGGSRVVLFQSTAVVPAGTPALTLSFDFFNALSDVIPLGGTPDSVFFTAFLGQSAFGSSFDLGVYDVAVGLLDADYRGPANLAPGTVASPSPKGAGWTRFTLPLPPAAVVTVGFEFIDGNGLSGLNGDSAAVVDNVLIEAAPVPEPAAAGGLLVALGTWLVRRRRGSSCSRFDP